MSYFRRAEKLELFVVDDFFFPSSPCSFHREICQKDGGAYTSHDFFLIVLMAPIRLRKFFKVVHRDCTVQLPLKSLGTWRLNLPPALKMYPKL